MEVMDFPVARDKGITIIMVTHEAGIASYAQRNIVMKDGLVGAITLFKQVQCFG